jgi:phospholipid/cholesterol/gamma-HCH transport system permease protein
VPEAPSGRGWVAQVRDGEVLLVLSQNWTETEFDPTALAPMLTLLEQSRWKTIRFESSQLGRVGSSLLAFLDSIRSTALRQNIGFDEAGLPGSTRHLMRLLPTRSPAAAAPRRPVSLRERIGSWVIASGGECFAVTALVGQIILRSGAALRGRASLRKLDVLACLSEAGAGALPVVALVNLLVGGIIAFVGSVELRRFGADIYIANLVGVAEIRELAPIMTAIVMSGRTGSAYAAQIATMQGTEELDALRVIGISPDDYLVLPRVAALSLMMPLLNLYAAAIGILGGFCVAILMLNLSPAVFVAQVEDAVTIPEVLFGVVKSLAFGAWVAISSCRIGLRAGRSASDVGRAATTASVNGIVGVILIDAIFAVCANALGL